MSATREAIVFESEAERRIFLGHMAFRFGVGAWTIYALSTDSLAKGLIAVAYLVVSLWVSQGIYLYQIGWARFHEKRERERIKHEAEVAKREAAAELLRQKQQEAAEKYFEESPA